MSRREVILIVSRAIAIFQLLSVLLELTYLPDRFYSLSHHSKVLLASSSEMNVYLWTGDRISIAMLLLRIIMYLIFAAVFWTCGPTIERFLCPVDPQNTGSVD